MSTDQFRQYRPDAPSYASRKTNNEWETHRELLIQLHNDGMPRPYMQEELKNRGFEVTAGQLARKMTQWNLLVRHRIQLTDPAISGQPVYFEDLGVYQSASRLDMATSGTADVPLSGLSLSSEPIQTQNSLTGQHTLHTTSYQGSTSTTRKDSIISTQAVYEADYSKKFRSWSLKETALILRKMKATKITNCLIPQGRCCCEDFIQGNGDFSNVFELYKMLSDESESGNTLSSYLARVRLRAGPSTDEDSSSRHRPQVERKLERLLAHPQFWDSVALGSSYTHHLTQCGMWFDYLFAPSFLIEYVEWCKTILSQDRRVLDLLDAFLNGAVSYERHMIDGSIVIEEQFLLAKNISLVLDCHWQSSKPSLTEQPLADMRIYNHAIGLLFAQNSSRIVEERVGSWEPDKQIVLSLQDIVDDFTTCEQIFENVPTYMEGFWGRFLRAYWICDPDQKLFGPSGLHMGLCMAHKAWELLKQDINHIDEDITTSPSSQSHSAGAIASPLLSNYANEFPVMNSSTDSSFQRFQTFSMQPVSINSQKSCLSVKSNWSEHMSMDSWRLERNLAIDQLLVEEETFGKVKAMQDDDGGDLDGNTMEGFETAS